MKTWEYCEQKKHFAVYFDFIRQTAIFLIAKLKFEKKTWLN